MGFYHAAATTKHKRSKHAVATREARITPTNVSTLNRLGCKVCPLNDEQCNTPKMQPTIPNKTLIYFISDAPSYQDDRNGEPLNSEYSNVVRDAIPDSWGYDEDTDCAFDNVVRTKPPSHIDKNGNQKERAVDWKEVECCRNHIIESIEEAKPKIIIGLGKIVLKWFLKTTDEDGMRGRFFPVKIGSHTCWFMNVYHPDFLKEKTYHKKELLKSRYGHCFKKDIEKAFKFLERNIKPVIKTRKEAIENIEIYNGNEEYEFDEVVNHLKAATKSKFSAVDVETYPLKPYNADAMLLSISISYFIKKEQVTFAFSLEHKDAKWTNTQLSQIKGHLKNYLIHNKNIKIAHNVPFELEWFMYLGGIELVDHHGWEDTMMQAQFIDERRGKKGDSITSYQSLNFLCLLYYGIALKSLFNLNMKNLKAEHIMDILLYNGVDAKFELMLYMKQRKILKERKMLKAFKVAKNRQPVVALMHHFGIPINQKILKEYQDKLNAIIKQLRNDIQELKVIKQYTKEYGEFKPLSPPNVLVVFKDYLKRDEIIVSDINGVKKYSTDEKHLAKIPHPLAKLITKLRNVNKTKSTYVDEFMFIKDEEGARGKLIHDDGNLHSVINTTFAETGRTSSDSPNMQNWPQKKDKWVRGSVVPGKNKIFIAADYGQLEWCTGCCCSLDKAMIDATWDGYDVHMEWAQRIGYKYPRLIGGKSGLKDKKIMEGFRGTVKNNMVFPAMFGAMNKTIADYMKIPENIMNDIMNEFWNNFHGLQDWQKVLMKKFYATGYVTAPNGRRRHYPMSKNQAINYPIQNAAADITCDSMVRLSEHAIQTNMLHLHPILNIHDDLTFCIPDTDQIIEESIETIYKYMLDTPFKWVNVPISVEISMGYYWNDMPKVGKFFSHKDLK